MRFLWIVLFTCAALASACRASGDASSATPVGTWKLVELAGIDVATLAEPLELVIGADGALSGYGGVNRFSGKADADALRDGQLRAGPLAATRRAGPPAAMEAESRFFELLGSVLEWRRSDGALELVHDGAVKARFVASAPR